MGNMAKVDAFCIDCLGMCRLRGVKDSMNLYQVWEEKKQERKTRKEKKKEKEKKD
jgi:hypothetical protein